MERNDQISGITYADEATKGRAGRHVVRRANCAKRPVPRTVGPRQTLL